MAYNFKSIVDVEVVAEPSESANVLIEENGMIKKAPKTAVGGAGGAGGYDAVIEGIDSGSGYFSSLELVSGNYQSLKDKITSYKCPNILVKYSGYEREGVCVVVGAWARTYGSEHWIELMVLGPHYTQMRMEIYPDGSMDN